MGDLNPLERRLLDWLSRRSDFFLAVLPIVTFVGLGAVGIVAVSAIARRTPDYYAQWLILALMIAAVALYLLGIEAMGVGLVRSRRFKLLELHQTMREIRAMSWREFEDLVAATYQARGYAIESRGGWLDGPDGGIDLIARKGNLFWLIQCKHWKYEWIEERPLRELLGVVTAKGAAGGIFVTSGVFDERALAFAKGNDKLELIGGEQLRELIASAVPSKDPEIKCPKCGSLMREKSGRFGPFLGCNNFPSCHGWLPIPSGATPG